MVTNHGKMSHVNVASGGGEEFPLQQLSIKAHFLGAINFINLSQLPFEMKRTATVLRRVVRPDDNIIL